MAAAFAAGSFALCIIDWQWISRILTGTSYAMLSADFVMQIRSVRKELQRYEERIAGNFK